MKTSEALAFPSEALLPQVFLTSCLESGQLDDNQLPGQWTMNQYKQLPGQWAILHDSHLRMGKGWAMGRISTFTRQRPIKGNDLWHASNEHKHQNPAPSIF